MMREVIIMLPNDRQLSVSRVVNTVDIHLDAELLTVLDMDEFKRWLGALERLTKDKP